MTKDQKQQIEKIEKDLENWNQINRKELICIDSLQILSNKRSCRMTRTKESQIRYTVTCKRSYDV